MPTQIVPIDVQAAPLPILVRSDVQALLVVAFRDGRPVGLATLSRPAGDVLSSDQLLKSVDVTNSTGAPAQKRVAAPMSIVICTRERPDDLARCLQSLAGARADGHEIIVVDNAPVTRATAAVVERFGLRSLTEPRVGLDHARNAGLAAATHDIVAFVDDDVAVSPSWASSIGVSFDEAAIGCATGLVLPLELETASQEEFELYSQQRRDLRPRVYSRNDLPASAAGVVGIGANMAFRRDVLRQLGGFDVRLDAGTPTRSGGDTDMFARVLDAGHSIAYSPAALVWHRHRRTRKELRSCVFGYGVGVHSMLTKRLVEQRDLGALVTAARWLLGPVVKAARAKMVGRPAPSWPVVFAEAAGAICGPFCFVYEARRRRAPRRA